MRPVALARWARALPLNFLKAIVKSLLVTIGPHRFLATYYECPQFIPLDAYDLYSLTLSE